MMASSGPLANNLRARTNPMKHKSLLLVSVNFTHVQRLWTTRLSVLLDSQFSSGVGDLDVQLLSTLNNLLSGLR